MDVRMKQFIPLTDEMLYSLAGPPAPLVPYRCGMHCRRELAEESAIEAYARVDSVAPSASPSTCLPA